MTNTQKPLFAPTHSKHHWPEDFEHENGNYNCVCGTCGTQFIGHKRRVQCKSCFVTAAVAERDALIAAAMKHYKNPNPKKEPFDLAMHAITEERNGRKCADNLWQEADERIEELVAERDQLKAALERISKASMGECGCYYTNRANIRIARETLTELEKHRA